MNEWPSSGTPRPALPRIEDLPISDRGYEQEAVRAAFDDFYRHAAQLDALLRSLEARSRAAAPRDDFRVQSSPGYVAQSWGASYAYAPRREVPAVVWRIAAEVAFLIAAAVLLGVTHLRPLLIVAGMAIALAIVALVEWLADRSRFLVPAAAAPAAAVPVEVVDEERWVDPVEPPEMLPAPDSMTMIEPAPKPEPEPVPEPSVEAVPEPEAVPDAAGPEPVAAEAPDPQPVAAEAPAPQPAETPETPDPPPDPPRRRRWFGRGDTAPEAAEAPPSPEPPSHVRVIREAEHEQPADPWEQGFDGSAEHEDAVAEPAESEPGRIRRRRR